MDYQSKIKKLQKLRDKEIIVLYSAGKNTIEVGKEFNLTHQRICQILSKYKIKRHPKVKIYTCTICKKQKKGSRNFYYRKGLICLVCVKKRKKRRKEMWAKNLELTNCLNCGTNKRKHIAKGYCYNCYYQQRNKLYYKKYYQRPEVIKRIKKYQKTEKYRKYQRDYNRKHYQKKKTQSLENNHEL